MLEVTSDSLRECSPQLSQALFEFLLRQGDNCLILSHRASQWCGHAPALEEDIAMSNIALDLVGQAQLWLSLAGEVEAKGRSADDLAYLRDAVDFRNMLLLELPNGDFGQTLMRQFLFDAWHLPMLKALIQSTDSRVAEIAEKASKEVAYHLERSAGLIIRLGDGTEESRQRVQAALELLWPYTHEFHLNDEIDSTLQENNTIPDLNRVSDDWSQVIDQVLSAATLTRPEGRGHQKGGRTGAHTEHLGFILAESQFLQRSYPGASW